MFRRPIQKTPPSVYIWRFQSTHTCRRPAANGQKDPKKKWKPPAQVSGQKGRKLPIDKLQMKTCLWPSGLCRWRCSRKQMTWNNGIFFLNEPLLTSWATNEKRGTLDFLLWKICRIQWSVWCVHSGHSKVAIDRPLTARFFLPSFRVIISDTGGPLSCSE